MVFFEKKIKVIDINDVNEKIRILKFDFKPDFIPGQFIQVIHNNKPSSFSITSIPKNNLEIAFIKVGIVTTFLKNVKKNDLVNVRGPFGRFTFDGSYKKILLLAGGLGVAPFISIMRFIKELSLGTDVILMYSTRFYNDIIYKELLDELSLLPNINIKYFLTRENNEKIIKEKIGFFDFKRIEKEDIEKIIDLKERISFVCGPSSFNETIINYLIELGVNKNNIKKEGW